MFRRDFVEATELALGKSQWVTVILAYLPRYQIYTKLIREGFTMISNICKIDYGGCTGEDLNSQYR